MVFRKATQPWISTLCESKTKAGRSLRLSRCCPFETCRGDDALTQHPVEILHHSRVPQVNTTHWVLPSGINLLLPKVAIRFDLQQFAARTSSCSSFPNNFCDPEPCFGNFPLSTAPWLADGLLRKFRIAEQARLRIQLTHRACTCFSYNHKRAIVKSSAFDE